MTTSDLPISARDSEPVLNPESASVTPAASSVIRSLVLALVCGVVAGMVGWGITESVMTPGSEDARDRLKDEQRTAVIWLRDAVSSFAIRGAVLGLSFGVAGGLAGRSVRRAGMAGATGLVLGGLAGAGMARWLAPIFYENLSAGDLTYSLGVNGGIWGGVGLVAGLAFGLGGGGAGRMLNAAIAGLGAGLLAMALYVFGGSVISPRALTDHPVSATPGSRLVAQLLLAFLVAAGAALADGSGSKGEASADGGR